MTLMMGVIYSSKLSADFQCTIWPYILEDRTLQINRNSFINIVKSNDNRYTEI
jgi:hypothetical protein